MKKLKKIFSKTSIEKFCDKKNKRFPIFLSFERSKNDKACGEYGRSQLDIAIDAYDYDSFNILLQATIQYQEGSESSHLARSWMI